MILEQDFGLEECPLIRLEFKESIPILNITNLSLVTFTVAFDMISRIIIVETLRKKYRIANDIQKILYKQS